ncbi:hypothetical protein BH09SUM1_BH09SUM1_29070 [soil metagenome]
MNYPEALAVVRSAAPFAAKTVKMLDKEKREGVIHLLAFFISLRRDFNAAFAHGGKELQQATLKAAGIISGLTGEANESLAPWGELRAVVQRAQIPRALFVDYLDALNVEILHHKFRDRREFDYFARRFAGAPLRAIARVLEIPDDALNAHATQSATAWFRVHALLSLKSDLARGKVFIEHAGEGIPTVVDIEANAAAAAGELDAARSLAAAIPEKTARRWAIAQVEWNARVVAKIQRAPMLVLENPARLVPGIIEELRIRN